MYFDKQCVRNTYWVWCSKIECLFSILALYPHFILISASCPYSCFRIRHLVPSQPSKVMQCNAMQCMRNAKQ